MFNLNLNNMKKLILLLSVITICFSCKKHTVEPTPEPEPIQTSKSFTVDISFTVDSLNQGYYICDNSHPAIIIISVDTVPYVTNGNSKGGQMSGFIGSFTYPTYNHTKTSTDMSKPLTYYINVEEWLYRQNSTVVIYKYSKLHTFTEGDNGMINFNTLP